MMLLRRQAASSATWSGRLSRGLPPATPHLPCACVAAQRRPAAAAVVGGPSKSYVAAAAAAAPPAPALTGEDDRFGGKVVDMGSVTACGSSAQLTAALGVSLPAWRASGYRGIWLSIPVGHTELMPAAIDAGFALHHTEPDRIVLNAWLSPDENLMPGYTTHTAGIGAVVMNERREILALQEATGPASQSGGAVEFWKYPTGLVNAGEGAAEAAVREVFEETGVDAEVVSLVAIREGHGAAAGGGGSSGIATNIFSVFLMRPKPGGSTEITVDPREVGILQLKPAFVQKKLMRKSLPSV
jgi:ADP-ribose pyrophosphatase YjhB (NUDIX family)